MVPYYAVIGYLLRLLVVVHCTRKLDTVHEWKQVDFTYPSHQARDNALRSRKFIPENCVILDVDVWQDPNLLENKIFVNGGHNSNKPTISERRIFVTIPRFKSGIPVTLATVTNQKRRNNTLLAPFPNWGAQREGNCEGVTSVYRTKIDSCGRLWVLDSGVVDNFSSNPRRVCRPQILVYDLRNGDRQILRYPIPLSQLEDYSLLVTLEVDIRDATCRDTFVYIADVTAFKLLVHDAKNGISWRVSSNYFYPWPLHGHFFIAGTHFNLMDGILSLALGPIRYGDRHLYFHSLASTREGSVATSIIRNRTLFEADSDSAWQSFAISEPRKTSQSAMEKMTDSGVMIFSLLSEIALACWNSQTPYTTDNMNIIYQDNETLQFPSGMKIIGNNLWVVTNEFQNYIAETAKPDDVKYRILHGSIEDLLKGTRCDPRSGGYLVYEPETVKYLDNNISAQPALTVSDRVGLPSPALRPGYAFSNAYYLDPNKRMENVNTNTNFPKRSPKFFD